MKTPEFSVRPTMAGPTAERKVEKSAEMSMV